MIKNSNEVLANKRLNQNFNYSLSMGYSTFGFLKYGVISFRVQFKFNKSKLKFKKKLSNVIFRS